LTSNRHSQNSLSTLSWKPKRGKRSG